MVVYTIGHGTRPLDELVAMLAAAGAQTLVDVRRFPGSRRNPQFNQGPLQGALAEAGIGYRHAVELGAPPGADPLEVARNRHLGCVGTAAVRAELLLGTGK